MVSNLISVTVSNMPNSTPRRPDVGVSVSLGYHGAIDSFFDQEGAFSVAPHNGANKNVSKT